MDPYTTLTLTGGVSASENCTIKEKKLNKNLGYTQSQRSFHTL